MLCSSGFLSKLLGKEKTFKHVIAAYASTGLRLWEQDIDTEIKFKIEEYWKDKINEVPNLKKLETRDKFYVLSMFPYPSGALHMGHVRVYTISDSVSRFYRMKGYHVLHPIGWDAFGLPAENAALERGRDPNEWTQRNISNMREQLKMLGCLFDWDREIQTCSPEYYKWTQWLFLKLFERGLIYRKQEFVNWDPIDQTVLADEQVDENNCSWRSGAKVEKKLLHQWFIKTTAFAESLMEGLDDRTLKEWRDIIAIQKHWIRECNGTNFDFELISNLPEYPKKLTLWTEFPEFVEEAKFVAISDKSILNKMETFNTTGATKRLNAKVKNPFTEKEIPIFVTNEIEFPPFRDNHLGIPCISEKDAEFCHSMGLKFESKNVQCFEERKQKQVEVLSKAKEWNIGGYPVSSKLRDWLISRQRYWGTPIPIVHCNVCGIQPVPKDQLPVLLPKITGSEFKAGKLSMLEASDWLQTKCPSCGSPARREADTMDTFVDSSWYFMRYVDPHNPFEIFALNKAEKFLPVDLYIGGKEHATLHLYYARFINHFLHSEGLLPTREPFKQLLVQGMVMGKTYRLKNTGKYLEEKEIKMVDDTCVESSSGEPVIAAWEKMSKSKHNGVNPMDAISSYGIDTTRLLILADVAPTSNRNWPPNTLPGILNWQFKLWKSVHQFIITRTKLQSGEIKSKVTEQKFAEEDTYMFDSRNYYIKGVTFNIIESQQLSVGISKLQGLTNSLRKVSLDCVGRSREFERALAAQIIMLAPMAPHFASELWSGFCLAPNRLVHNDEIQWDKDVLQQKWPELDAAYKLTLYVFVNGNEIMKLKIPGTELNGMTIDEAARLVMKEKKFNKHLFGKRIISLWLDLDEGNDASIAFVVQQKEKKALQANVM